jgi:predicted HTH domain antitoxin
MLQTQDFVKAKLYSDEQSVIQDALRSLLQTRPALRLEMAIYRYQMGTISLGKAANLAGVSFEQMREVLLNRGITLHLGPETREEANAELTTLRSHLDATRR